MEFLDAFYSELKNNSTCKVISKDIWILHLPFLDRHRDYLEFEVKKTLEAYLISNYDIIYDLKSHNKFSYSDSEANRMINHHIIDIKDDAISTLATKKEFGWRLSELVQACLALDAHFNTKI